MRWTRKTIEVQVVASSRLATAKPTNVEMRNHNFLKECYEVVKQFVVDCWRMSYWVRQVKRRLGEMKIEQEWLVGWFYYKIWCSEANVNLCPYLWWFLTTTWSRWWSSWERELGRGVVLKFLIHLSRKKPWEKLWVPTAPSGETRQARAQARFIQAEHKTKCLPVVDYWLISIPILKRSPWLACCQQFDEGPWTSET